MKIGFWVVQPQVLTLRNIANVLDQSSHLLVFAQMVVILTRGFDLSLGTTVSTGSVFGIRVTILLAVALCEALYFVLNGTVFGRSLYLIGSNPRAARLAGLPSKRFLTIAYVVCSMLAAFGALMMTARTGSGEPSLGGSLMIESIAASAFKAGRVGCRRPCSAPCSSPRCPMAWICSR